MVKLTSLKFCANCGMRINSNNQSGLCNNCRRTKRKYLFKKLEAPRGLNYKEILEKEKGLPSLSDHLKLKKLEAFKNLEKFYAK